MGMESEFIELGLEGERACDMAVIQWGRGERSGHMGDEAMHVQSVW